MPRFCKLLVGIMFIEYSHWSKDIVFVISDSHLDGMHAWLTAYHEPSNTGASSELFKSKSLKGRIGLDIEPLSITSGVVWTALNIDYPGHSFSHLGVFRGATTVSLKACY